MKKKQNSSGRSERKKGRDNKNNSENNVMVDKVISLVWKIALVGLVLALVVEGMSLIGVKLGYPGLSDAEVLNVKEMNSLSNSSEIDYMSSTYLKGLDIYYIVTEDGNEYRVNNASKKNLSSLAEDNYIRQYFEELDDLGHLTSRKGILNVEDITRNIFRFISIVLPPVIIFSVLRVAFEGASPDKGSGITEKLEVPDMNFRDVRGHVEAKKDLSLMLEMLKNKSKYESMGVEVPSSVLLTGPPGTGKTLMAKAFAGEAGLPIFVASGGDFVEMFAGLGASRVRSLFKVARENAPSIIFIDEIDSIGGKRGTNRTNSEDDKVLHQLLAELDGFKDRSDVIVMASTNHMELLDPALTRPGRFDKHIYLGNPDKIEREDLLDLFMEGKSFADGVTPESIAMKTYGFSGAELKGIIVEAGLIAVMNDRLQITMDDINHAIIKTTGGDIREDYDREGYVQEIISRHEAGHAIVNRLLCGKEVPQVSIVPTTNGALGWTQVGPGENEELPSKSDVLGIIMSLYAGRAAEEIYFGNRDQITTGASNDIEVATKYIASYVMHYGFDDNLGMLNYKVMHEVGASEGLEVGASMRKLSEELYNDTLEFLENHWELVEDVSASLIENETIDGETLEAIIEEYKITD